MLDIMKKNYQLVSPIDGETMDLEKVDDMVFAEKLAGDGLAIVSTGDILVAPGDGKLTLIFKTNHAVVITLKSGVEILVHIGLDTIKLCGEGFTRLVEQGENVKAGQPIIKLDRKYIEGRGCTLVVPLLITKPQEVNFSLENIGKKVSAGQDILINYRLNKRREF
ncbi:MAG: PTS glucose transporter subunit IIA [Clostridiaceae bacterium]